MMMSNLEKIKNELDETKNDLTKVEAQLENHLRTTTTTATSTKTTTTTATTTTTITTTIKSTIPSLQFKKSGPFASSLNNKIGEIQTYHKNFEFSMEVKYNSIQKPNQLLLVSQDPSYSIVSSMIILSYNTVSKKFGIHFWNGGKSDWRYVSTPNFIATSWQKEI